MKVLVIDDDRDLVDLLRYSFRREGYTVATAHDGLGGMQVFQIESPDLVVLDLVMPKMGGLELLKQLREQSSVPVIVLSGLGDEDNVVNALQIGADDYLVKPFRPRELRARTKALLRRSRERMERTEKLTKPMTVGDITLEPGMQAAKVGESMIRLTKTEFALLQFLMLNRDVVVRVSEIVENVWGYDANNNDEVVKVAISRLRRKLEPDPTHPRYIANVPGAGYVFRFKTQEA